MLIMFLSVKLILNGNKDCNKGEKCRKNLSLINYCSIKIWFFFDNLRNLIENPINYILFFNKARKVFLGSISDWGWDKAKNAFIVLCSQSNDWQVFFHPFLFIQGNSDDCMDNLYIMWLGTCVC